MALIKKNTKIKLVTPISEELVKHREFDAEYMVYFTPRQAEGPYNDVYLYCYIKHGLITKDTMVMKKGEKTLQNAGDCDDLSRFFREFNK